jgi:F-type H+-transporting ATPase subunit b
MLQIDLLRVLFQAINFLVLVFLLYRLLFRPVMRAVHERSVRTQALIESAEQEQQEARAMQSELEEQEQRVQIEADEIIREARQRAEEEHGAILKAVHQEAEQVIVDARAEARGERLLTISQYNEAMLDLMLDVSGRLIGRVMPDATHDALVNQISERIYELGRESMAQVEAFRRSIAGREPDALVTSARGLSPEQQGQLARTLTALADRHVNLRIEQDPELVAGIRLRMGDLVIENSIQGELERLREAVNHMLEERMQHE